MAIAGAIARRNIHAAAERDGEVRVVATHTLAFIEDLPGRHRGARMLVHAREKPIELWWQDEARVGQHGTLTRVWAERGSPAARPARSAPRLGLPIRRCLPASRYRRGYGAA